jgi:FkbM family methyltransferase
MSAFEVQEPSMTITSATHVQESALSPPHRGHDRFFDIRERIGVPDPLIVDGGAHRGDTIDRFLALYDAPEIHAFEPIPALARDLQYKYATTEGVIIHDKALGSRDGATPFHVVENLVSSSVLEPGPCAMTYHGTRLQVRNTIWVGGVRLDEVLDGRSIHILKLDLQGYELEALKGCERLLDSIKVIATEVEFIPLYNGQPLFADIDLFLRNRGFRLLNLYDLYTHPDGQLTAADAVYLNTRLL